MADKEITARSQTIGKTFHQSSTAGLIKIDHDIATEDGIEGGTHGPLAVEQINAFELQQRPQFGAYRMQWPGEQGIEYHLPHGSWAPFWLANAIALLTIESPISGDMVLSHLPPSRRAGTKPFLIEGLNTETGQWEMPLPGRRYGEFQAGVQLANRTGALNEIEYSEFVQKIQGFAELIGALVDFPDMLDAVARRFRELFPAGRGGAGSRCAQKRSLGQDRRRCREVVPDGRVRQAGHERDRSHHTRRADGDHDQRVRRGRR